MNRQFGFTILELLVVVTVIVLLMALLAPALEKAIYQAELTICAARLRTIASGVSHYALDHRRAYPYRAGIDAPGWYKPNALTKGVQGERYDDRPLLSPYMPINEAFNDPMCGKIDIEGADPAAWIWTPYQLWAGFGFRSVGQNQHQRMTRMGQRMSWTDTSNSAMGKKHFSLLASDMDFIRGESPTTSHPDASGILRPERLQDQDAPPQNQVADGDPRAKITAAGWVAGRRRGLIDLNWAYDDLSVRRTNQVGYKDDGSEKRMFPVPGFSNNTQWPDTWIQIPVE